MLDLFLRYLWVWQKRKSESTYKFDPWVSMFRLSGWLWPGNVFVLIFTLVQPQTSK